MNKPPHPALPTERLGRNEGKGLAVFIFQLNSVYRNFLFSTLGTLAHFRHFSHLT